MISSGYSDCIDREKIFTAEALRSQSKDFLIKDSDLCELGGSAVNRAAA
jgi:hypothetical protein